MSRTLARILSSLVSVGLGPLKPARRAIVRTLIAEDLVPVVGVDTPMGPSSSIARTAASSSTRARF